jgi:serine protease
LANDYPRIADMVRQVSLLLLAIAALPVIAAPEHNPVRARAPAEAPVERLIVKLRPAAAARAQAPVAVPAAQALETLGARAGVLLAHSHGITTEMHVARLFRGLDAAELDATLARLNADPAVEYASADRRKQAHGLAPNDTLYAYPSVVAGPSGMETGQWYQQAPQPVPPNGTTTSAVNATAAWAITTGSAGVVIADLDTGVRFDHPDLQRAGLGGKLLPGYDFVGCDENIDGSCSGTFFAANDGDGWDPDPSDPGDWISAADLKLPVFSTGCTQDSSSWHGTRTAGLLGALTNNGIGIAGMVWGTWVQPVRVLGKCGGYDSDILAAMLWAGGITVTGAPANPYPARIINMSLGSVNACAASYQDTIRQLTAKGTVVVASAGNEGGPVDEPANCPGVIGVAGVRHVGTKVGYSSLGPEAALAAPAGNCPPAGLAPCLFSIDTTVNLGATVPGQNSYTDQVNYNVGTSFSAPIVAGIAALMLSVNGNLTPSQLRERLQNAAKRNPFPVITTDSSGQPIPMCKAPTGFKDTSQAIECNCTTGTCGAGLADALGSVNDALRPIAAIAVAGTVSAGQPVALSAAGSAGACGRAIASYAWSIVSGPGTPSLTSTNGPTTSLNAAPSSGTVTVQLVVTDDQGLTDTVTIAIGPSSFTTTAPASAGATECLAALPPPAPTVTITVSPTSITVGESATLTWSSIDASSCTASGAWSGTKNPSDTLSVTPSAAGSLSYTLACTGTGGTVNSVATLTVTAVAAAAPSHGGGGALDAATLGLGALFGLAARRRRAAALTPTR